MKKCETCGRVIVPWQKRCKDCREDEKEDPRPVNTDKNDYTGRHYDPVFRRTTFWKSNEDLKDKFIDDCF